MAKDDHVFSKCSDIDINRLKNKYFNLIKKVVHLFLIENHAPFTYYEAIEIAMGGFYNAVINYEEEKSSFYNYLVLNINYALLGERRKRLRDNLGYAFSLDDLVEKDNDFLEVYCLNDGNDVSKSYFLRETSSEIDKLLASLPPIEQDIFYYYKIGYSYQEIAQKVNKEFKFVDNSIQRTKMIIKSNVKKFLNA